MFAVKLELIPLILVIAAVLLQALSAQTGQETVSGGEEGEILQEAGGVNHQPVGGREDQHQHQHCHQVRVQGTGLSIV